MSNINSIYETAGKFYAQSISGEPSPFNHESQFQVAEWLFENRAQTEVFVRDSAGRIIRSMRRVDIDGIAGWVVEEAVE